MNIELQVDRDKAIRLMKEMADYWNMLPWEITYKSDTEKGLDDETCKWIELYEIDGNMERIEKLFQQLFGKDYQKILEGK